MMFDPNNVENIMYEIENVVYDDKKLSELIFKGRNNINNFSWKKCADKTEEIYEKII